MFWKTATRFSVFTMSAKVYRKPFNSRDSSISFCGAAAGDRVQFLIELLAAVEILHHSNKGV